MILQMWKDDFADARNFAHSKASGQWILCIDADEVLDLSAASKIQNLLAKPLADVFRFTKRTYTDLPYTPGWVELSQSDQEKIGFPGYSDRFSENLYRKSEELVWEKRVHESLLPSARRAKRQSRDTNILIHHFEERKPEAFQKRKALGYLRLATMRVKEDPTNAANWFDVGIELTKQGQLSEAETAFLKSIELRPDFSEAKQHLERIYNLVL